MRVLVAPDKFAGTLTAPEAAQAIAAGWCRAAPGDEVDLAPLSDGGPGFVDAIHAALGGRLHPVTVRGPLGAPTPASLLQVEKTAYVESAQACGLALTGARGAEHATTYGVGELLRTAVESGARRIVVGLGGSGSNDAGAGLLAALGARADVPLDRGGVALAGVGEVDLTAARALLSGVELVAASDVDNPLTGPSGATAVFGPQKGLTPEQLPLLDEMLAAFAGRADPETGAAPGAGAAGGLGFALLALGARRRAGLDVVADAIGLGERIAAADVAVTGEGSLDASTSGGKAPAGVARLAAAVGTPCLAIAGRVEGSAQAHGLAAAYSLVDEVGETRALTAPAEALAEVACRAAGRFAREGGE